MKRIFSVALFFILFIGFLSCTQKSDYEKRVENELNRDTRVDSLFLGYHFGMTTKEFLDYSWNLNKEQVITGGARITYVLDRLKSNATMEFYPEFYDGKIYKMPVDVNYNGWAPWNFHLISDSLIVELVEMYEEDYNTNFFTHSFPGEEHESYVAIQGNRQIKLTPVDDRIARIEFLDLSVKTDGSRR